MKRKAGLLALPLLLAACHSSSDDTGGVTRDEAHQLDDAAAMLDANSVDINAVDISATDEDQPE